MKKDDYIGASISTRMYEKNLLTRADLERLNDYDSLRDVLNQLNDTIYRESINNLARPEEYENILKSELRRSYEVIRDIAPDKDILNYMQEKYNFHNLKVLIKEIVQDKDYSNLYLDMGDIDLSYIKKNLIKEEDKSNIFDNIEGLKSKKEVEISKNVNDIYLSFAKEAMDKFKETNNPQDIDISLDKNYYERLLEDANNLGLESLIDFTKERIDLMNLKSLLRIKSQEESIEKLDEALIDGGFIEKRKV